MVARWSNAKLVNGVYTLTYAFESYLPQFPGMVQVAAYKAAADAWCAVANLDIREVVKPPTPTDIVIEAREFPGVWSTSLRPYGDDGQLRTAYNPNPPGTWTLDRTSINELDYRAAVAQEMGNTLGLDEMLAPVGSLMHRGQTPGVYTPQAWDIAEIQKLYGPPKGVSTVPTIQIDCAGSVAAGASFPVTFTVSNTGPDTWTNDVYKLGSQLPQDNSIWGTSRVLLSSNLPPGGVLAFKVNLKAPAGTGNYSFGWRMVKEGDYWFGFVTSKGITVTPADQPVVPAPVPSGPPKSLSGLGADGKTYVYVLQ